MSWGSTRILLNYIHPLLSSPIGLSVTFAHQSSNDVLWKSDKKKDHIKCPTDCQACSKAYGIHVLCNTIVMFAFGRGGGSIRYHLQYMVKVLYSDWCCIGVTELTLPVKLSCVIFSDSIKNNFKSRKGVCVEGRGWGTIGCCCWSLDPPRSLLNVLAKSVFCGPACLPW